MMKIGINMLLWTDLVAEEQYTIIDKLQKTGYDGIEVPIFGGETSDYTKIGKHLKDIGMGVTSLTSLSPEENIVNPDKKIQQAGVDKIKWAIDLSCELGSELLCGPFHSSFKVMTDLPPSSDERKRSAENLSVAAEYAGSHGVILAPEALNRFECYMYNTMKDLKELVDTVNHPNLGAMYDTHHGNIEETSQKKAFNTLGSALKHVHISENQRGIPGVGQVHWQEVFSTLKEMNYSGWLTIEAFSRLIPDFANAINVWRSYGSEQEIYEKGYEFIKSNIS
jgi:D-psicose/D-tagatose/L-ribulose 3-epimerase